MALITCREAALGYDNGVVVSGLNFSVEAGDYLCVVGENGSGKSTLIKGLLRLKTPVSGEIVMGDGLRPNEIGYLPQQSAAQKDFPASVFEVVLSGRQSKGGFRPFYSKKDKAVAMENMEKLGIAHLKNYCYRELSGGQQQKALLARALCATEKLLLLDEPVAGLDPLATREMYEMIRQLNQNQKLTVIMVSHDIRSAVEYADHILHLGNQQLFFGATGDYLQTDLAKRFLGGEHRV
ncbi:MAG TPA: metal ABC transporter ATP-binding protein [Clostridiales bacterium]|nr:metal ABC transporter ATP-binding protein [Clostridiales bacterium]